MDNRTPEKVRFLADAGFRQVVLARELLCRRYAVSMRRVPTCRSKSLYTGLFASVIAGSAMSARLVSGRSANRGECAQFCRLPFSLVDADGKTIVRNKHLLSLKDLNQSEVLEELLDAGATSLKIEGRLKDVTYVKNVTAAYRRKLDAIFARRKEYTRASSVLAISTSNRSLTRASAVVSRITSYKAGRGNHFIDTPKSLGEEMGTLKEQRGGYITVAGVNLSTTETASVFWTSKDVAGFPYQPGGR